MNAYHGWIGEDVINHIAMVLKIIDSIYIPGMDSHQLRMKIFHLLLDDEAKQWWINEREGKITIWEELVEKFFFENKRRVDESILRSNNTTTNLFFKPYLVTHGKSDTKKEDEQSQIKRKYSNTSEFIDEQPNKKMCKAEKFEAIQYSLGPYEEYVAIRRCEYDIWERNEDNMSIIYQDIFQKKDNGWKVTRTK
ncbi:hypothetical protein Tco_1354782 [Tanacetum coccineum]